MLRAMSTDVTPGIQLGRIGARYRPAVFAIDRIPRDVIDDATLRPLHAWSTRLMAEGYDHFARHALTNDELHVFRRDGDLVGFQLWRAFTVARTRYVLGGKLRVDPSARSNGLHHASNLAVLRAQRAAHADLPLVRLSIASLFGFVSLARAMPRYQFVDAATEPVIAAVFERVAATRRPGSSTSGSRSRPTSSRSSLRATSSRPRRARTSPATQTSRATAASSRSRSMPTRTTSPTSLPGVGCRRCFL
jgi:hypothetical protein